MIKKIFRPFWSYDIVKTERWLSSMAQQGFQLVDLNFTLRLFKFESTLKKEALYKISYNTKSNKNMPKALIQNNWQQVLGNKHWSFILNDAATSTIKAFPSKEGILTRNEKLMHTIGYILIFIIMMSLPNLLTELFLLPSITKWNEVHTVTYFWYDYISYLVMFPLLSLLIYTFFKLKSSNRTLSKQDELSQNTENMHKKTERELIKANKIIAKRKIGWIYSPDKLEEWLEEMESSGFNLYRVSYWGSKFFFLKGKARKVKYCADYQSRANEEYFNINQEEGWKLQFTAPGKFQKWSIWCKEYSEEEATPELYYDKATKIQHGKRVAVNYILMLVPVLVLYIILVGVIVVKSLHAGEIYPATIFVITLFLLTAIECSILAIRIVRYYLRIKTD